MSISQIINYVLILIVVLPSLTIHEFAHGWVAYKFGDNTAKSMGRLTLNPIAHIDPFGTILAVGITGMMFWQVFINVGMAMGLMPIVGVTLPFVSYGGSSVITTMICIGLLLNISMRRFLYEP